MLVAVSIASNLSGGLFESLAGGVAYGDSALATMSARSEDDKRRLSVGLID